MENRLTFLIFTCHSGIQLTLSNNNISIIINGILLLAFGLTYLYYLGKKGDKEAKKRKKKNTRSTEKNLH